VSYIVLVINKKGGEMSYYYDVSVLVLFIAIITLTNIAGNPKYQIHAQTEGPIIYQQPTIDTHRPRRRKLPYFPRVPAIPHHGVQHIPPIRPIRPPPKNV